MQPSVVLNLGEMRHVAEPPLFLRSTGRFFVHYVRRRALRFGTLLALVAGRRPALSPASTG
jgi:hypothetical protein